MFKFAVSALVAVQIAEAFEMTFGDQTSFITAVDRENDNIKCTGTANEVLVDDEETGSQSIVLILQWTMGGDKYDEGSYAQGFA